MQILAFDYGAKYIGIAVGQTITKTSSPLTVLDVKEEGKNLWNTINALLDEWKPDQLLVGKPLNMDGSDSDMMKIAEKFLKKLKRTSNIPCEFVDERLTSIEAKKLMNFSKTQSRVDDLAAKIFLDDWMEHYVNSN